jgi:hypothetical protein
LALKLLMGLLLILKKDNLLVEKTILEKGKSGGALNSLTNMQAIVGMEYLEKYETENKLRREKAKVYNEILKLYRVRAGDIFFHYRVFSKRAGEVKWMGWRNNLDVQDDYCEDVESLYTNKVGITLNWLYLPTNPEIPESLIKKFAREIKKYVDKGSLNQDK